MTPASHTKFRTRRYLIPARFFTRRFGWWKIATLRELASCVMLLPGCRRRRKVHGLVLRAGSSWRDSSVHVGSVEQIEMSSPNRAPVFVRGRHGRTVVEGGVESPSIKTQ